MQPSTAEAEDALEMMLAQVNQDVAEGEEARFLRALGQIEDYVEDHLLLLRRERASLLERLAQAQDEFDKAVGERTAVEKRSRKHRTELEKVEAALARLEQRDDETYQRLRDQAFERRYRPVRVERLLEAEVSIL